MEQPGLGKEHLNKCAHAACACTVEPSQTYCSEECAKASAANTSAELPGRKDAHGGACGCGHDACEREYAARGGVSSALHGSATGASHKDRALDDPKIREAAKEVFKQTGED